MRGVPLTETIRWMDDWPLYPICATNVRDLREGLGYTCTNEQAVAIVLANQPKLPRLIGLSKARIQATMPNSVAHLRAKPGPVERKQLEKYGPMGLAMATMWVLGK